MTIQLTSSLFKASKDFDPLCLLNRNHELFRSDPYYTVRMWDYFVEQLMGAKLPKDHSLQPSLKRSDVRY